MTGGVVTWGARDWGAPDSGELMTPLLGGLMTWGGALDSGGS